MASAFRMSVSVDHDANAAYVQLGANPVATTEEYSQAVLVDLDELGVVVGIEFLSLTAPVDLDDLARRYHLTSRALDVLNRSVKSTSSFVTAPATGQLTQGLVSH